MPLLKQDTKESLRNTCKDSIIILIYEFIGTGILTTLVCNYCYQLHIKEG
jgi:glycerol uptake facilitator-like aquaporin